jgi:hypothetical protein
MTSTVRRSYPTPDVRPFVAPIAAWPHAGRWLHSGYPTRARANYIGMAVHTAARICDAAHGGQIVVSGDFRLPIGVPLPRGVRVRRLGTYRLRGLPDEIELLQVVTDELPAALPAAQGLAVRRPIEPATPRGPCFQGRTGWR